MTQIKLLNFSLLFLVSVLTVLSGCRQTLSKEPGKIYQCNDLIGESVQNNSGVYGNTLSKDILNVKLENILSEEEIKNLAKEHNALVLNYIKSINFITLQINQNNSKTNSSALLSDPRVDDIFPAISVQLEPVPIESIQESSSEPSKTINDPRYNSQYSLKLMQIEEAWGINSGNKNIKIAIIDTGIDLNHPDLKNKIVKGYNVQEKDSPPLDDIGHGTHIAGIVAATVNNNIGIAGVCKECTIMPVKVLKNTKGIDSDIAEGIVWSVDNGARVINMSIGITKSSKPVEQALKYALEKNVILVAAAGNENKEHQIHLPSKYPGVIEVAATDSNDKRAMYSNFGKTVSVSAPGSRVLSTFSTNPLHKCGPYNAMSGTSMAAPHVSGLAALILSQKDTLLPAQVKNLIESTSIDLGETGWDQYYGHGRIDAFAALTKINSKSLILKTP